MLRRTTLLLAMCVMISIVAAQESEQKVLHIAENDSGKVWANLTLTLQRGSEPFLPIVVAVQNKSSKNVVVNRESLWLTDLEGIVYFMPSVKELRQNYNKVGLDYRMVSYGGIPWEGWYRNRRLASSNFFPNLQASRGSTTMDHITLRKGHAMVDLVYFERPRGLAPDKPFFLDIHAKGWEIPIRLRLVLS